MDGAPDKASSATAPLAQSPLARGGKTVTSTLMTPGAEAPRQTTATEAPATIAKVHFLLSDAVAPLVSGDAPGLTAMVPTAMAQSPASAEIAHATATAAATVATVMMATAMAGPEFEPTCDALPKSSADLALALVPVMAVELDVNACGQEIAVEMASVTAAVEHISSASIANGSVATLPHALGNKNEAENAKEVRSSEEMAAMQEKTATLDEDAAALEDPRETVLELLTDFSDVGPVGAFAVGGRLIDTLVLPGLEVDGLGSIGLPLTASQAAQLATQCEQAPYGKGENTIVDACVRDTWQLPPERFRLRNPRWRGQLDVLVKQVCDSLGVREEVNVEAQLYKLLLYNKSGFFKPHRDSEKADGMFATLVVTLPSLHTGGCLHVVHGKETVSFDFGGQESEFCGHFTAFYADCQHEVTPLVSGHRLCLVYNLVKVGAGPRPAAAVVSDCTRQLRQAACQWDRRHNGDSHCEDKIVIVTKHLYTPAAKAASGGLKFKSTDDIIVSRLEAAIAAGAPLKWTTGTISKTETGTACGDEYGGYGRYRRYGRYRGYSSEEEDYSWEETIDEETTLDTDGCGILSLVIRTHLHARTP